MKRALTGSWIAFAVVTGAVAAGCGGSGPQQVTAAELIPKADAICGDEREEYAKLQADPPANASAARDQTKDLIDATESSLSDLKNLEPPLEVRAAYDRYLNAVERAVGQMRAGANAADDRDSRAYAAAQTAVAQTEAKRAQLARALGLKVCSKPGA